MDAVRSRVNESSEVVLVGDNYDAAYAATMKCIEEEGRVLVHPFNDPLVIAGRGVRAGRVRLCGAHPGPVAVASLLANMSARCRKRDPEACTLVVPRDPFWGVGTEPSWSTNPRGESGSAAGVSVDVALHVPAGDRGRPDNGRALHEPH